MKGSARTRRVTPEAVRCAQMGWQRPGVYGHEYNVRAHAGGASPKARAPLAARVWITSRRTGRSPRSNAIRSPPTAGST